MNTLLSIRPLFVVVWVVTALILAFILGFSVTILLKIRKQKRINDAAPEITRRASVVSKRNHVFGARHTHTFYYVTFEFDDGGRTELAAASSLFGLLVEGDMGQLTYKGTQILSFTRE